MERYVDKSDRNIHRNRHINTEKAEMDIDRNIEKDQQTYSDSYVL